ncbi:HTTM domain-containing protein [Sanguibacter sp. A247]|uniref:HTTM domain-containing protein n=1 Tax=unclassified Sanguibacter TaxID=2645534 RepID=UPI003FD7B6F5
MNALATAVRRPVDHLVEVLTSTRHGLYGMSALRILVGSIILVDLAIHVPVRYALWGPDSWYTVEKMERDERLGLSLLGLGNSYLAVDLGLLALAAAAALLVVGWRTAFVTPALWVLLWGLHERNPYVTNGGDNLVRILLVYMIFAQLDAHWSLSARRRRRTRDLGHEQLQRAAGPRTLVHNLALVACVAQVCVLYLSSGLFKAQGRMWQEGTAVYYITRVAEYNAWPELTALLVRSPLTITVLTYGSVLLQVAFVFCLTSRRARHLVFVGLLGMHAGIGLLMGLPVFSAFMIAADVLLFTDAEWRRGLARLAALRRSVARERAVPEAALAPATGSLPSHPGGPHAVLS